MKPTYTTASLAPGQSSSGTYVFPDGSYLVETVTVAGSPSTPSTINSVTAATVNATAATIFGGDFLYSEDYYTILGRAFTLNYNSAFDYNGTKCNLGES